MNSDHAEAIVVEQASLQTAEQNRGRISQLPRPAVREATCKSTATPFPQYLNDIMMPVLAEHPQLDDKLFEAAALTPAISSNSADQHWFATEGLPPREDQRDSSLSPAPFPPHAPTPLLFGSHLDRWADAE